MNRKEIVSILILLLVLVMFGSCASSEERAAQKAEFARKVNAALDKKAYKISVNRMVPMKVTQTTMVFQSVLRVFSGISSLICFALKGTFVWRQGAFTSYSAMPLLCLAKRSLVVLRNVSRLVFSAVV